MAAPFFGRPVLTMTLVSKLLRRVDVDIVVGAVTRGIRDDPVRAREPAQVRVVDATVHVDQPRAVQVPVPREFPRHPPPVLPEPRPRSSVDVSCAVRVVAEHDRLVARRVCHRLHRPRVVPVVPRRSR